MMPCEDVRNLIEAHLDETLDEPTRHAVTTHLKTCPSCHRAVEEARLAAMVLHGTAPLPSPPDLASRIKAAARTRLCHRPRPLHERALGSPAFMATCASLLCGAIICLAAILRVGAVPPEAAPAQWVAPPLEVHSLVTVAPIDQPGALHASLTAVTSRRPLAVRNVDHSERRLLVLDLPAAHTPV
ncbi:MAG: zf-HC2 domain-containing protein, partial [Armatimonadota bacterium]